MGLTLVRNDITRMQVDAIVNTANRRAGYSRGTDSAVYHAAGAAELLKAREEIGNMRPGQVAVTDGFNLPADYIIHAVGTRWIDGESGEREVLALCYSRALAKAAALDCESIAIPLLGTGNFGYPRSEALAIAMTEIRRFLATSDMDVYLVLFDEAATELGRNLFGELEAYIDDNYAAAQAEDELDEAWCSDGASSDISRSSIRSAGTIGHIYETQSFGAGAPDKAGIPKKKRSLDDLAGQIGDSFGTTLQRLIDERGLENPQVYTRAFMSRQTFNKIINNMSLPKKDTVLVLAITLELSLDETIDLLSRAGHALSPARYQDMIVRYFIEDENYDWEDIDEAFVHFNLTPLYA